MRIELDGAALADALKNVPRGTNSKLPILQHALLEAEGDTLRLHSTDLEAHLVTELPAKVSEPGRICAQIDLLAAAARPGVFKLKHSDGDAVAIANPHGGSRLRIPTLSADDFPVPQDGDWTTVPIDGAILADAIARVGYAAGSSDHRFFFNCIAIMPGYIGATSGHRLAIHDADYDGPPLLIPIKQTRELSRLLGTHARLAYMPAVSGASRFRVESGNCTLSVSLIDHGYVDLRAALPTPADLSASFVFDREKLLESARRFMPFCTNRAAAKKTEPPVILAVAEGGAQLLDWSRDNAENCSWALGAHEGDGEIPMRAEYLIDVLDAIRVDKVRFTPWKKTATMFGVIVEGATSPSDRHQIVGVVI